MLPTIVPNVMLSCPVSNDLMLTANSGELVPKATTVKPIIRGEILIANASLDAPLTNDSAPIIRRSNPVINRRIAKISFGFRSASYLYFYNITVYCINGSCNVKKLQCRSTVGNSSVPQAVSLITVSGL